jgi:hypothetical protein
MPKGPRGERRPSDVIGNAVKVMRIATGEEFEDSAISRTLPRCILSALVPISACRHPALLASTTFLAGAVRGSQFRSWLSRV